MANPCAALDPTWAHLPAPAPTHAAASHYRLFPAAAFENEALTAALRASMAPAHTTGAADTAAAKSFSPATPSSSTSSASELLSSGHDAPAPPSRPAAAGRQPARALKGPKEGRVSKRKPRPSRRAETTYITADPADFRRMVQEITGLPVPVPAPAPAPVPAGPATGAASVAPSWTPPVLPTLDTSAFLLDRATAAPPAVPEYKCSSGSAPAAAAGDHDYSSSLLLEMEAMIDFPTLESWGIIG